MKHRPIQEETHRNTHVGLKQTDRERENTQTIGPTLLRQTERNIARKIDSNGEYGQYPRRRLRRMLNKSLLLPYVTYVPKHDIACFNNDDDDEKNDDHNSCRPYTV